MCVLQCWWMDCRGQCTPALILLLPLSFLSFTFPIPQGERHISKPLLEPPVLTEMPTSQTIFYLGDIDLPCEATGNPAPTFRWVKDGELFGPEYVGSGTLKTEELGNPLELYEGHFRCYASNTLGTAMTPTVKVIVEPELADVKKQIHKRAFQGESIILSCNPPETSISPSIHWMDARLVHIRQTERVTLGLDGNLYFANLAMYDTKKDYICYAQYTEARTVVQATAVNLTVEQRGVFNGSKPDFFQPASTNSSVMVLRDHEITLECIPNGLPTPKVEWKKKDGILENTTGQVARFARWLRFDSITQDDDGEYECKASNIHGFATRSFTVTVEAAPYWVKKPPSLMYSPGETVKLDCQAEGTPKPNITWRINGVLVTEVDEGPRRTVASGLMILRDVNVGDTAVYQCEATNVHGSILLNAYVYVIETPPQILSSDGVIYEAVVGGDIALHCESFGSPRPHVIWERGDMVPLLSDPRVSLEINGTLRLSGVSSEDGGVYTCSIGTTNSSITAELHVFNRTVILSGPRDISAVPGTSVLLDCRFYVDPRLPGYRVAWKQGSRTLLESSADDKYTIFENGTLKVVDVQFSDTSEYSCEVITDLDYVKAQGAIIVIVPPSNVTVVSNITSVSLSWVLGEPCRHDGFRIHYLSRSGKWEESEVVNSAFYTLTGLQPGTVYHLRMTHRNKTVWEGEAKTAEADSRLSITSWLIRSICTFIIITMLALILIIIKWRQGSKYREHPLTGTPGSACEDSAYQSLDPATRDLDQTYTHTSHLRLWTQSWV